MLQHPPIGPLRRFWALDEERIILASALMHHLRKRINAQRLGLSTCKTGALPLSYGPKHCYIWIIADTPNCQGIERDKQSHSARRADNCRRTGATPILSKGIAQR